jgi:hypothetical protein
MGDIADQCINGFRCQSCAQIIDWKEPGRFRTCPACLEYQAAEQVESEGIEVDFTFAGFDAIDHLFKGDWDHYTAIQSMVDAAPFTPGENHLREIGTPPVKVVFAYHPTERLVVIKHPDEVR